MSHKEVAARHGYKSSSVISNLKVRYPEARRDAHLTENVHFDQDLDMDTYHQILKDLDELTYQCGEVIIDTAAGHRVLCLAKRGCQGTGRHRGESVQGILRF